MTYYHLLVLVVLVILFIYLLKVECLPLHKENIFPYILSVNILNYLMYTENLQNMLYYYITIYSIIDKELSLLVLYQKRCDYIYIILYVILCSIILLKISKCICDKIWYCVYKYIYMGTCMCNICTQYCTYMTILYIHENIYCVIYVVMIKTYVLVNTFFYTPSHTVYFTWNVQLCKK